jgi:pectate lyase C
MFLKRTVLGPPLDGTAFVIVPRPSCIQPAFAQVRKSSLSRRPGAEGHVMHVRTLRVSTLHQACTLILLSAALGCGSEDPFPNPEAPAQNPAPAAPTGPGQAPNPSAGNPATTPPTTGVTPTPTAPGVSTEGMGPIDLTPPSEGTGDDGEGGEQTGGEGNPPVVQPPAPTIPTVPVGGGACPAPDGLIAMLQAFAPADEDLAEDFAGYLGEEVGPLTCATSGSGGSRTITQTIVVPPNTIYDGGGEVLTADPTSMNCDLTEGEQAESQRPYFLLAPGASVRNVTINFPGCEGIHMMGNNILDNITWVDVGEDAASVRSYFPGGTFAILNSQADHASDKIFQFNAPGALLIQDFVGTDMGKLVRQNGGTEFEFHVDLNNVTVTQAISAVVQSDSPLCFVRHHNLSFEFTGSGDKSDRVFRDIPVENVTEY